MWLQPPPPVTNRWVLHIAASPHEVDDVLIELCIHKRARPIGDPGYPAYLAGRGAPYEPPDWMSFVRSELERRGYRTLWCEPDCVHHPWPPRTESPAAASPSDAQTPASAAGWRAAARHRSGASLRRLASGAPHHRAAVATPGPAMRAQGARG